MKQRGLKIVAVVFSIVLWIQAPMVQAAEKIGILNTKVSMLDGNKGCQVYRVYASSFEKRNCYRILDIEYITQDANGKSIDLVTDYVPVTALGVPEQKYGGTDYMSKKAVYFNLFGRMIEPWEDYVAPAGDPPSWDNIQVRTLILPNQVTKVEPATFAKMPELKKIYLPRGLGSLEKFTFFGCEKLEEIVFPDSIEINDPTVFMGCTKLKGLQKRTKSIKEPLPISYDDNLVMDFDKKTLIQVMPTAKQITILAGIEEIEPSAFAGSSLTTVKVEKGNKTFAVNGRCLYNKKSGKLVLAFGRGNKLTLSKKIRKIDKDAMVSKYKVKKLVMPKKLKRAKGWKKPFIANNDKIKIYYCKKRI